MRRQHQKVGPEPDMQMSDQVLAKAIHAVNVVFIFQDFEPSQIVRQFCAPFDKQKRAFSAGPLHSQLVEDVGPRMSDFTDDQSCAFDEIVDLHQQFVAGAQHLIGAQTGEPELLLDDAVNDLEERGVRTTCVWASLYAMTTSTYGLPCVA